MLKFSKNQRNANTSLIKFPYKILLFSFLLILLCNYSAVALDTDDKASDQVIMFNTLWVMIAGVFVFFMNAGFAMLETGFCRQRNSINLLAKNLIVFCISVVAYYICGYALMFGSGNEYWGINGFFLHQWGKGNPVSLLLGSNLDSSAIESVFPIFGEFNSPLPLLAHFFFQLTFASTAATIVSGAVAERIRFGVFLVFCLVFVGFIYPIGGHLAWSSQGFLYKLGFRDFAGSTVVHTVGGMAGFVGTWMLGSRNKKYQKVPPDFQFIWRKIFHFIPISLERTFRRKRIMAIPSHNLSLSTLGCFILWLGWFGFNGGSSLCAEPTLITHIVVATFMAGACGALSSTLLAWLFFDHPSLSYIINGILGGCVSITASCAFVSIANAAWIGVIGGAFVILCTLLLEWGEIDDPVGAVPVHLGCGFWGTLSVGLFSDERVYKQWEDLISYPNSAGWIVGGGIEQLLHQIAGFFIVSLVSLILTGLFVWPLLGLVFYRPSQQSANPNNLFQRIRMGLRVSAEEEEKGLDQLFAEGAKPNLEKQFVTEEWYKALCSASPERLYEVSWKVCDVVAREVGLSDNILMKKGLKVLQKRITSDQYQDIWLEESLSRYFEQLEQRQWILQDRINVDDVQTIKKYYNCLGQAEAVNAMKMAIIAETINFETTLEVIKESYSAIKALSATRDSEDDSSTILRRLNYVIFSTLGVYEEENQEDNSRVK